jgi:hypothetical protein
MEQEIQNPEGGQEQKVELTPVEQEALQSGWVPKEEFNGDEHKWVDAAEYLRRGDLFKKIESQSRELKDVKRALLEMKKLHSEVREVEYTRALETLKAQKKTALEEGDADAVIAADERIDLVKEQQRQLQQEVNQPQQSGEEHPEFVEWKTKNTWYTSNGPMKAFADALGQELASQGVSPSAVLKKVEEEIKKEFSHKFQNPRQNRVGAVEGSTGRGGASGNSFQLSPEEKKIMHTFVRTGVMSEQEYIKELKKVKGV